MAAKREYIKTVVTRIKRDRRFARAFCADAISTLRNGETTNALFRLRLLVHAGITFGELARQTGLSQETLQLFLDQRNLRAPYTWHLRSPIKEEFDRSHWWDGKSEVEPIAALYEIVRRHPVVGCMRLGMWDGLGGRRLDAFDCLLSIGLKPWSKLSKPKRHYWEWSLVSIKGIDCRDASQQCTVIEEDASCIIMTKRLHRDWDKLEKKTVKEATRLLEKDMIKHPPTPDEMAAAVAKEAKSAYWRGYILIAVAPDLAADKAESLMAREYRRHRKVKQRARFENWLPLISEFEDAETGHQGAKAQVFARYKRVLDAIKKPEPVDLHFFPLLRPAHPRKKPPHT